MPLLFKRKIFETFSKIINGRNFFQSSFREFTRVDQTFNKSIYIIWLAILNIMWNLVCSNRFLERKMHQESQRRHRNSLRKVKPLIDIEPPSSFSFLASNPKKAQIQQQCLREIQLVNTDLLRRMTATSKNNFSFGSKTERHSLNQDYTKRLSLVISKENKKMKQRLRDASSLINFSKMEKEHQLTQRLKENLSRTRPTSGNSSKRSCLRPQSAR